jgi:hypothetical protein
MANIFLGGFYVQEPLIVSLSLAPTPKKPKPAAQITNSLEAQKGSLETESYQHVAGNSALFDGLMQNRGRAFFA